ncbi:MAG: hydrogenase maturation peptidase HycI [Thermoplasmatota archaeon]
MKTVVLCIGNRDGGDDAIGPYIADRLSTIQLHDMIIIDAGIAPENFTGAIKQHNPDTLLIIDAIDMSITPGEIRMVPPQRIGLMHISTHGIPLSVFIKYLEQYMKKIILIGIQPQHMQGVMSKQVRKSADILIASLVSNTVHNIALLP